MKTYRIRKDDKVMVITGKDAGKIGKVLKILRKKDRVLVEKTNMAKRHMRPNPYARRAAKPPRWATSTSSPKASKRKCASAKSATKSWNKVIR